MRFHRREVRKTDGAENYRRYLDGDDGGLAELVGTYKDGLTLFLNGYVHDLHRAEELTEDTFFRLMTKKPHFSGKSAFKSWLYAIGRHIALDDLRRNGAHPTVPLEDADAVLAEEKTETAYFRAEERRGLYRALAQLNPEYRQVLWLIYFEQCTNGEAAAILNKNERQIRNLLYRAKQSLKARLNPSDFSEI